MTIRIRKMVSPLGQIKRGNRVEREFDDLSKVNSPFESRSDLAGPVPQYEPFVTTWWTANEFIHHRKLIAVRKKLKFLWHAF